MVIRNRSGSDVSTRHEYRASELVPTAWLRAQPASNFAVYDPAVVRFQTASN